MDKPVVAFVAGGKLYIQDSAGDARLVESAFVQSILSRVEKNRERDSWKSDKLAWQFGRGASPLGIPQPAAETRRIHFTGVAAGESGKDVHYTIDSDYACGLFHQDLANEFERRMFHRKQFRASDLARSRDSGAIAMSVRGPDGTAHIATMAAEGRGVTDITEGDAVDEAPSWVPGKPNLLLYQSAGIGRNRQGGFTGLAPYAIQQIDLESNAMQTLVEEEHVDVISPKMAGDSTLYYIRRPYQPFGATMSWWRMVQDTVLFPFRLVLAIVHFLNLFSMIFSKKPLLTADGPRREGPDQRILMLYGRYIDAQKIMRSARRGDAPALVPPTWELIRKPPGQAESVCATSVLSYDLCDDGSVVYTTGSKVFHVAAAGDAVEIGRGEMIERITVLQAKRAVN
jgi:hypothetical protein